MSERMGDWMQTYCGVQFWPLDPHADEVRIEDIAHSLANQCRFAGHCTRFYSVAQHSVIVSEVVSFSDPANALWGLLHDAAEAYLVDLPRPIKRFSTLGMHYKGIESQLMETICFAFGLALEEPVSVKLADNIALMTEKRDLMPNSPAKWVEVAEPLADLIVPLSPDEAERLFINTFWRLRGEA